MKNKKSLVLACINHRFIAHCKTDTWGFSVLIMEKTGKAFCRLYRYNNDITTVYLDWLSVDEKSRKKGIGTKLQEIREEIGRKLGATTSCLWVKKDSWMHKWYQRRGYLDFMDYEQEENAIWMKKSLVSRNEK